MRQPKKNYLLVVAIGERDERHHLNLAQFAGHMGCTIEQSHIAVLGQGYTANFLLSGNWGAIAKFEAALPHFQQKHALKILTQRTEQTDHSQTAMHYYAQIIAYQNPEHIEHVMGFFLEQEISILELSSLNYTSQHTQSHLFSMTLTVQVPEDHSLSDLREQFMIFCDELNIDGILEAEN